MCWIIKLSFVLSVIRYTGVFMQMYSRGHSLHMKLKVLCFLVFLLDEFLLH